MSEEKISKNKINYRRANIDGIDILVNFRIRFLNEFYKHPEDNETEILKKELKEYFSKAIPSGDFIGWLAGYNGKVVSTGRMVIWQMPPRYGLKSGRLGYILNMYTIPQARRKGICTQLLNKLIKETKSLRLTYFHLHPSEEGINIYRKAGFVKPGLIELELRLE